MAIRTFGTNAVDWEQRVDFGRLRAERLARLKAQLERSDLGALLSFDMPNTRYMTATHIGTWAMDKLIRFTLLPRGGEPVAWDFGSASRSGSKSAGSARTGWASTAGPTRRSASTSRRCRSWRRCGPRGSRRSTASRSSSRRAGSRPPTRSSCSPRRARWSTPLTTSCTSSCGPGCARTSASAWSARSCTTWAASTWRASTQSRASAARRTRTFSATGSCGPAIPRSSTSCSFNGYRTCYYARSRWAAPRVPARAPPVPRYVDSGSPWSSPARRPVKSLSLWPRAEEFGFPDETAAFALRYGHGVGLSIWEKPIFQ